jgi:hypothetical protein
VSGRRTRLNSPAVTVSNHQILFHMALIDRGRPLTPSLDASRFQRSLSPALTPNFHSHVPQQFKQRRRQSITESHDVAGDLAILKRNPGAACLSKPYQYVESRLSPGRPLDASPRLLPSPIASPLLSPRNFHSTQELDISQLPTLVLDEAEKPDMYDLMATNNSLGQTPNLGQPTQPIIQQSSWLSRSKLKLFASEVSSASQAAVTKGGGNKMVTTLAVLGAAALSGEDGGRSIPLKLYEKVMGDD